MKKKLLIILSIVLTYSCKHELESPKWDTDIIIPIAHTKLNINNIVSDTTTIVDEEGFVSLIYQEKLLDANYDSLLLLETVSEEKSIKIDSVNFDDVVIEYPTTIGSIINELPFGSIGFPDGSQREIISFPGIVQNDSILIDASEYFETMTLYNGMLELEVTNGFPTDISNISITLYNATNQNIIADFDTPLIASGTTYTKSVSVAGETLDHLMIALINNIDLNASNGQVTINYSDAITTKVSITNIKIMEATAYFPNQLLYEEYHEEPFDLGSARITEIGIKEGNVIINASSTLPDTGTIIYTIPSLTKNGQPFETNVKIPPNISNELTKFTFNFDGYVMDLTGKEGRQGGDTVNTIYSTLHAYLDSTGELETIHQVDSFYLFNEYYFIPEYAKGYIGQDTLILGPEIVETDIFDLIHSGSIDIEETDMKIEINNYIGASAAFKITNLSVLNDNTEINANINNNNIYNIERASLSSNNSIIPTYTAINIDADEMIEIFPNKINTSATFYLNPDGQGNIEDFLFPSYPIKANIGVEIPLSFIADQLKLINSSNVDIENIEEIEMLYISIKNGLPLEAELILIGLDETEQFVDTLMSGQHILAAITDSDGKVIEKSLSRLEILNNNISDIRNIQAVATFSTQPQNEHINIYSNYEMEIIISARIKIGSEK